MYTSKTSLAVVLSAFYVSSCGNDGGGPAPENADIAGTANSFDFEYTSAAVLGSNVNDDAAVDSGPEISANGLELYFHSNRDGGLGSMDIYVSTRPDIDSDWGPATSLGATVNSDADDRAPALSADGLRLYFSSDRAGGYGDLDLYMSSRASGDEPWSAPENLGNVINTQYKEASPDVSADGHSLYFLADVPGGYGGNDLYVSTRPAESDPWSPATNMGETINTPDFEAAPEIASDGLTLYFHSSRPDVLGGHNIWRVTRATTEDDWGTPGLLPMPVNSGTVDVEPGLSNDWQTLYFATDQGNSRDIWQANP